jgi:hypothetical protein
MEKIKYALIVFLLISASAGYWTIGSASNYLHQEFMSLKDAEKKWGKKKFESGKFKIGGETLRASMTANLIKSGYYIGKPFKKVLEDLGTSTGYFQNDGIPSYIITPESKTKNEKKEVWQIVFIPDDKWQKVKEVKIHKNCCNK